MTIRRRRLAGNSYAARLALLGHLRQERQAGGARLRAGMYLIGSPTRGRPEPNLVERGCDRRGVCHGRATRMPGHRRAVSVRNAPASAASIPKRGSYGSYASFKEPDGNVGCSRRSPRDLHDVDPRDTP